MGKFGIGQPVPRTEDPRFLTGRGCYVADIRRRDEAPGFVLRSPHAHARVVAIDAQAARALPGVLAVLTGADAEADGLGSIPCNVTSAAYGGPAGHSAPLPVLARDKV